MLKNLFVDWTEYHAFCQRIDNDIQEKTCYNWVKSSLKDLVTKFNKFMVNHTEGTAALSS